MIRPGSRRMFAVVLVALGVLGVLVWACAESTYAINGKVVNSSGAAVSGVTLTATGRSGASAVGTSASDGRYRLQGLRAGSYVVKASKSGKHYRPSERRVTVGPNATHVDFAEVASAEPYLEHAALNPANGNIHTTFTFGITYVHPDGTRPDKAQLYLDGQVRNMTCSSTSGDSRRYTFEMKLPAGSHKYRFRFEVDGKVLRYPGPDEDDWYHTPTVADGG